MGSVGRGEGSEPPGKRKGRKRNLLLDSSDSEEEGYFISPRETAGTGAEGNAGAEGRDSSARPEQKVADSVGGCCSEKKAGERKRSNTESDAKSGKAEASDSGRSMCADGIDGKKVRLGFPEQRLERAEVRAGCVVSLKRKEQTPDSGRPTRADGAKRRRVEEPGREKQRLLKADPGISADRSKGETDRAAPDVIRVQGKNGVLKLHRGDGEKSRVTAPSKHQDKTAGEKPSVTPASKDLDKIAGEKARVIAASKDLDSTAREKSRATAASKDLHENAGEKSRIAAMSKDLDKNAPEKPGVTAVSKELNKYAGEKSRVTAASKDLGKNAGKKSSVTAASNDLDNIAQEKSAVTPASKDLDNIVGEKSRAIVPSKGLDNIAGKKPRAAARSKGLDNNAGEISRAAAASKDLDSNAEKKAVERVICPLQLRKSEPSVGGVSLSKTTKQQDSKGRMKVKRLQDDKPLTDNSSKSRISDIIDRPAASMPRKRDKKRLPEDKPLLDDNLSKRRKLDAVDPPVESLLKKHDMKRPKAGSRSKVKQEVRDQIKRILLDNGWKIDLRPRRGKAYEDSVYVSPKGTGYWSITKAYAVFQDELKNSHDGKRSKKSSKLHNLDQEGDPFCAIPKDNLAMLKRNVVNKRRRKEELDVAEKKDGDSRTASSKDIVKRRHSRSEDLNDIDDRVKTKHRGYALVVRGTTRGVEENMDCGYIPYEWKRTILSWMIDLGVVAEDAKVKYMNKKRTRTRLEGKVTREGIHCSCCCKILTVSKFELHAGSKELQPYENIFVEDTGVSLLQCLHNAWDKQSMCDKKGYHEVKAGDDPNDDTCGICGDGGDLVCCDRCPSTFHLACLGIQMPPGDWYCRNCLCRFCGSAQEKTACFAELFSCLQCRRKYHLACAQESAKDSASVNVHGADDSFCSSGCRKIYKRLNKLLGVKNDMEAGFSWSLIRCLDKKRFASQKMPAHLVECNSKTAVAFSVMDECFRPIIDDRSGINMIHNVVYNCGSNVSRLDFSGFYTFILERSDEIISTASVRIHGTEMAEMPFIGTRGMYRRQGMCRRLLNEFESVLRSLKVKRLVVPAISELKNTWTTVFGFKAVEPSNERVKSLNLLIFHDTGLLQKSLLPRDARSRHTTASAGHTVACDKMDAQMPDKATGSSNAVDVSDEFIQSGNLEIKDHEHRSPTTGACKVSTSDVLSSAPEAIGVETSEMTPCLPGGDAQIFEKTTRSSTAVHVSDEFVVTGNLLAEDREHHSPTNGGYTVSTSDALQSCKVEVDHTKEGKDAETYLATESTLDETNAAEEKSVAVGYPCAAASDETVRGGDSACGKLAVDETVVLTDKPGPNPTCNSQGSDGLAKPEEGKSSVVPVDSVMSAVDKNGGALDNHELKAVVPDAQFQKSKEAKDSENNTELIDAAPKTCGGDSSVVPADCVMSAVNKDGALDDHKLEDKDGALDEHKIEAASADTEFQKSKENDSENNTQMMNGLAKPEERMSSVVPVDSVMSAADMDCALDDHEVKAVAPDAEFQKSKEAQDSENETGMIDGLSKPDEREVIKAIVPDAEFQKSKETKDSENNTEMINGLAKPDESVSSVVPLDGITSVADKDTALDDQGLNAVVAHGEFQECKEGKDPENDTPMVLKDASRDGGQSSLVDSATHDAVDAAI